MISMIIWWEGFRARVLIGGVAKGHPDDRDLAAAVEFYKKLIAGGVVNE